MIVAIIGVCHLNATYPLSTRTSRLIDSDLVGFAVDPAHQGKGLAKKMLQWGFDRSEEEKLPIYLEASPAGDPVYIHYGFKPIGHFEMFDGSEIVRCMIRRPQSAPEEANGTIGQK